MSMFIECDRCREKMLANHGYQLLLRDRICVTRPSTYGFDLCPTCAKELCDLLKRKDVKGETK